MGVMQAGLYLGGTLKSNASGFTHTRIHLNGREAPMYDLTRLRSVGVNPIPGQRLWINPDGSCGLEGSPYVMGNAFMSTGFSKGVKLGAFLGGIFLGSLFR